MKSHLTKRLSKYKVSKVIFECKLLNHKEVCKILHKRGYIEQEDHWRNAFVKVTLFPSFILVEHTISKEDSGVKCVYEKDYFLEFLRYFEYKFKRD